MRTKLTIILLAGALLLGIIAGSLAFFPGARNAIHTAPPADAPVGFHGIYTAITHDDMIAQADAIFVGDIVAISPTQWNQDSGEYWQSDDFTALPLHQVQIAVVQALVDTIGLGQETTITVIGSSPTGGSPRAGEPILANQPEHTLQVQQRALFFVAQRELPWRRSVDDHVVKRPIIRLMGAPALNYLTAESDGLYHSARPDEQPMSLADVIARIQTIRSDVMVAAP